MASAPVTPLNFDREGGLHAPRLAHTVGFRRTLRVLVLLLAVAILNAIDLLYTLVANSIHQLHEMNPLAAVFLQQGLISSLISFKLLMVICGLGMLWKLRSSRLTLPACWVLLLAYSYLGLVWYQWVNVISGN
jgi:hypothetical protein